MKVPSLIITVITLVSTTADTAPSQYDDVILDLRARVAALRAKVAKLEASRQLQEQCGFVLNNGECELASPLNVTGDVMVEGNIETIGEANTTFLGDVNVNGSLSTNTKVIANGEVLVSGDLTSNGNAEFDGGVDVLGETRFWGNIRARDIDTGDAIAYDDIDSGDDDNWFSRETVIRGELSTTSDLEVSSDTDMYVYGMAIFEDDVTIDVDYTPETDEEDNYITFTVEGETVGVYLNVPNDELNVDDIYIQDGCTGCDD